MFAQKLLGDFDGGKQLVCGYVFQPPRPLVLARLLEVNTVGRAIQRELTLLAAALRADAPVDCRAEAFFLANTADRATQS